MILDEVFKFVLERLCRDSCTFAFPLECLIRIFLGFFGTCLVHLLQDVAFLSRTFAGSITRECAQRPLLSSIGMLVRSPL